MRTIEDRVEVVADVVGVLEDSVGVGHPVALGRRCVPGGAFRACLGRRSTNGSQTGHKNESACVGEPTRVLVKHPPRASGRSRTPRG